MQKKGIKLSFLILLFLLLTMTIAIVSATDNSMSNQEKDVYNLQTSNQLLNYEQGDELSPTDDFKVKKNPVMYFHGPGNPIVNETEEYSVDLKDKNGKSIPNQTLTFTFNNETFKSYTDGYSYGYSYKPHEKGLLNITVTFSGNDEFNPISINDTLVVKRPFVPLEVALYHDDNENINYKLGETVKLRGIISDVVGYQYDIGDALLYFNADDYLDFVKGYYIFRDNYYEGKDVFITVNDQNYTTKVKDNTFSMDFVLNKVGEYKVSTLIDETERYDVLEDVQTFTVTEKTAKLFVNRDYVHPTLDGEANFVAYLIDDDSTDNMLNQNITVKYYEDKFNVSSDKDGFFHFSLKPKKSGVNEFYVYFYGNGIYNNLSSYMDFSIEEEESINQNDIPLDIIPADEDNDNTHSDVNNKIIKSINLNNNKKDYTDKSKIVGSTDIGSNIDESVTNITKNQTNNTEEEPSLESDIEEKTTYNTSYKPILLVLLIILILVVLYLVNNRK